MTPSDYNHLCRHLLATVHAAGRVEMDVFRQDFAVAWKPDDSPVTLADRRAEEIILAALAQIAADVPVVAEEAASAGTTPAVGRRFFLVDPLDGTREFIRKSHEFTVNIGLIEDGVPVFGIVYAPALQRCYLTAAGDEAVVGQLDPDRPAPAFAAVDWQRIATREPPSAGLAVVASSSHMTGPTRAYIDRQPVAELTQAGSSLKFCWLAEGRADLYPRFGPTMEWDTAAGHALLAAAGGEVVLEDGTPLRYGKAAAGFRNPSFIARGRRAR